MGSGGGFVKIRYNGSGLNLNNGNNTFQDIASNNFIVSDSSYTITNCRQWWGNVSSAQDLNARSFMTLGFETHIAIVFAASVDLTGKHAYC